MNPNFKDWATAIIDSALGSNSYGNLNLYSDLVVGLTQAYEQGLNKGLLQGRAEGKEEFKKELQRQVDKLIIDKSNELRN